METKQRPMETKTSRHPWTPSETIRETPWRPGETIRETPGDQARQLDPAETPETKGDLWRPDRNGDQAETHGDQGRPADTHEEQARLSERPLETRSDN